MLEAGFYMDYGKRLLWVAVGVEYLCDTRLLLSLRSCAM
jgi:hypothetical protein